MKKVMIILSTTLTLFASTNWRDVFGRMHKWPAWWKILIALALSVFCAFTVLYSLDLWADFFLM